MRVFGIHMVIGKCLPCRNALVTIKVLYSLIHRQVHGMKMLGTVPNWRQRLSISIPCISSYRRRAQMQQSIWGVREAVLYNTSKKVSEIEIQMAEEGKVEPLLAYSTLVCMLRRGEKKMNHHHPTEWEEVLGGNVLGRGNRGKEFDRKRIQIRRPVRWFQSLVDTILTVSMFIYCTQSYIQT